MTCSHLEVHLGGLRATQPGVDPAPYDASCPCLHAEEDQKRLRVVGTCDGRLHADVQREQVWSRALSQSGSVEHNRDWQLRSPFDVATLGGQSEPRRIQCVDLLRVGHGPPRGLRPVVSLHHKRCIDTCDWVVGLRQ
eukprot:6275323-Prymnesium_polylepis.1